ncbi:MAG: hypothetical protein ABI317_00080 [Gaiellales bacterium]
MAADVERAEAHLLEHCMQFTRWLDDAGARTSAQGRLCDELDDHTIAILTDGLAPHPYQFRSGLTR